MRFLRTVSIGCLLLIFCSGVFAAGDGIPSEPLVTVVDMNVGETAQVELSDGSTAQIEVQALDVHKDPVIGAVRSADVRLEVNGVEATITADNYQLPVELGGVQIDCPVTIHYMATSTTDSWGLHKDVRLRLWPKGSPWVKPGTFVYPVVQQWLATETWYSNEPVRARESDGKIYYHDGIDIGGAEALVPVVAAAPGKVVSVEDSTLGMFDHDPVSPRYDVVYVLDERGWYYRYSHLEWIHPQVKLGERIKAGDVIGRIGKEGHSGGWTHLHFEIKSRQPSGEWGTRDSYAFMWQSYQRLYEPDVMAVARPRKWAYVGDEVTLDGSKSWARGGVASFQWTLTDGSVQEGSSITHQYDEAGNYTEILKVTDSEGNVDYDFATVRIVDPNAADSPASVHATYYPTFGIEPGDEVIFKARAGGTTEGYETWDFGDGSSTVRTQSNQDPDNHAPVGYATTTHRYDEPGNYIVTVTRSNEYGTGVDRLHVVVEEPE